MNLNSRLQFNRKIPLSNQTPGTVQTGNATWDAALKESLGIGQFPEAGSTAALQPGLCAHTQHHPAARYTQGQEQAGAQGQARSGAHYLTWDCWMGVQLLRLQCIPNWMPYS